MKIMVVGDSHGDYKVVERKVKMANALGITDIIIVGDFGLWPGLEGIQFLDKINAAAAQHNVNIHALPGNHEDHYQWDKWLEMGMPKSKAGFTYIRSNVLICPKVHTWKWAGKRFFVCGGAVSIDRMWRVEGKSWWPNETFSEKNLESVLKYKGKSPDFLFTHDCSNYTPWGMKLIPDLASMQNRERLDIAISHLKPKMHFHGHMHKRYEWDNNHHDADYPTETYGLECDNERFSWGILDVESGEFCWGS